jgi:hypothetical protein
MFKPIEVRALTDYKLWLRYSDGSEGEVDLAEFVGKGVFKLWDDYSTFEKVYIGEHGQVAWNDEIDMCPDALYLRLTGKTPEEIFPNLREMSVDA